MVRCFLWLRPMNSHPDFHTLTIEFGKSGVLTDSTSGFLVLMLAAKIAKSPSKSIDVYCES